MGVYDTLHGKIKCTKCGKEFNAEIQEKWSWGWYEDIFIGDKIDADKDGVYNFCHGEDSEYTSEEYKDTDKRLKVECPNCERSVLVRATVENGILKKLESVDETFPIKVIFLDVDGVLNFKDSAEKVMKDKVAMLKEIVDRTGAKIVLSSDWRYWWGTGDKDFLHLWQALFDFGIHLGEKTPITKHGYRGAEIHQFLDEWKGEPIEKFVILDDGDDMKPYIDRLVQTSFEKGLERKHVERAVELLNE